MKHETRPMIFRRVKEEEEEEVMFVYGCCCCCGCCWFACSSLELLLTVLMNISDYDVPFSKNHHKEEVLDGVIYELWN